MNKLACFFTLLLIAFVFGCAGSAEKNPVSPTSPLTGQVASATNRHLWGMWDVSINADRSSIEIAPMRTADMHLNVVKLIETKPCATCLTIKHIYPSGPNELFAEITLFHPYPGFLKYTGFDVRGIFISQADFTFPSSAQTIALGDTVPRMLDPDGYTSLFNPDDFPSTIPSYLGYIPGKRATGGDLTSTINPFIAFRKDAPRRMFEPGGWETKNIRIHAPAGSLHFGYAVDVCWQPVDNVVDPLTDFPPDANCLEAYSISVDIGSGPEPFVGSSVPIQVAIFDHQGQDTIYSVTIESPNIFTGEITLNYSTALPNGGYLFAGTLPNELSAVEGEYPLLVKAIDVESDQNLGNVAAWQVTWVKVGILKGWARTWGGAGDNQGHSVAIDSFGNAYITGSYIGTVDFDPGPGIDNHTSIVDNYEVFLSKFDPNGNFIWARTWGGYCGNSVAIDSSGNVLVTGEFIGTVDFDPGAGVDNIESTGYNDVFLSKFESNGEFVWARTWGGDYDENGSSVAIDGSGNAYVAGNFHGEVDFDPGAGEDYQQSGSSKGIFVSKFDTNGNYIWARNWGGTVSFPIEPSVATDGSGNAYITGAFGATVDFDPGSGLDSHTSNGGDDVFLSKFEPSGNFAWARTWGGSENDEGCSVSIDSSGNAYLTGRFEETVDFDPGAGVDNHSAKGSYDVFLSKFELSGNFIWARTWAGSSTDVGEAVAIDASGNPVITGSFGGAVDFDPGAGIDNHTSNSIDAFLSKLDSNGNLIWARTWGGEGEDRAYSVAIDGSGNLYITGAFEDTADFDPGVWVDNHTSNGESDAFLSKFPPDGNW
jgi:hypothetical protein